VFQIRICFLRIRILDFFPNPDPDPGNKKLIFQRQKQNFGRNFCFQTQKVGILFLFSTNQVDILLNKELFLKISENH